MMHDVCGWREPIFRRFICNVRLIIVPNLQRQRFKENAPSHHHIYIYIYTIRSSYKFYYKIATSRLRTAELRTTIKLFLGIWKMSHHIIIWARYTNGIRFSRSSRTNNASSRFLHPLCRSVKACDVDGFFFFFFK